VIEAEVERYSDPQSFAKEVNLPLLAAGRVDPVPPGASLAALLAVEPPPELAQAVQGLVETRRSLTLRSLLLAGFPEDRECFAVGLALAREWTRRGMTLAVVDLDFWNPTVVRPRPHPNEGFLDVLEYGCSFRRVAWEIAAGSLWVVGPGSYPPEESRVVEHPDWERAARNFAGHADVTLFVAPLLHRRGLVGQLSKRMDGVILAASVQRTGRTQLRDSFLELWGSDAPIIGCVGIDAGEPTAGTAALACDTENAGSKRDLWTPVMPEGRELWGSGAPISVVPVPVEPWDGVERRGVPPAAGVRESEDELASKLEEEVRSGRASFRRIGRSRAGLIGGVVAGLAVAASVIAIVMRTPSLPPGDEVLPAGTERVLPAPERPLTAALGGGPSMLPQGDATPPAPSGAAAPPAAGPSGLVTVAPAQPVEVPAGLAPSPASPAKPFRVHVASFRSHEKVEQIAAGLRAKGADAWIEKATDAPGYYRVFVGRFATEAEARAQAKWLLQHGWVDRAQAYPSTVR